MSDAHGTSIEALLDQLRKVNGESADRRTKLRAAKARIDELTQALDALKAEKAAIEQRKTTLEQERDQWKSKYETTPDEWKQKYEAVQGQIKDRNHKDAIRALYDDPELGLRKDVPVEKLIGLLGYQPEADEPDPVALKAMIAGARESDPYLFAPRAVKAPDAGGPATPTVPPELPPGPGAPRGAADGHASGVVVVTQAQRRDAEWMRQNQARIAAAQKEGRLQFA